VARDWPRDHIYRAARQGKRAATAAQKKQACVPRPR
jgi:hypothetical protein